MSIWCPDLAPFPGPRYKALADALEHDIRRGRLPAGAKLPPHRRLADALRVTIGTVARGYAEAERRQLISAQVGSGTFVRRGSAAHNGFAIESGIDDGVVDLSLSMAIPSAHEQDVGRVLSRLAADPAILTEVLQYQPEAGLLRQRKAAAQWLEELGVPTDAEHVLICNGGQHAINVGLQTLARPADLIAAEGLSYPGFIGAARRQSMRVMGVRIDHGGLDPEALDTVCRQFNPRALYCMPAVHNPTCATQDEGRRRAIVEVARRHDLWLIEDGVVPTVDEPPGPPLAALAPERVLYIHSAAKILAGGLRVGFLVVPTGVADKARGVLRSHCWMAPPLMAELAMRWRASDEGRALRVWQHKEIEARQAAVQRILGRYRFRTARTAFNVWLPLPEPWHSSPFVGRLAERGVRVQPADIFAVGRYPAPAAVRLCISSARSLADLERGLAIIAQTLEEDPVLEPTAY